MTASLRDHYRCPACRGDLTEQPEGLSCRNCGAVYPLEDGRMDFLPEENTGDSPGLIEPLFRVVAPVYQSLYFPFLYRLGTLPHFHSPEAGADNLADRTPAGAETVLDLACGTGLLTRKLAERHGIVHGLDLSGAMLRQAHRKTPQHLSGTIDYARGNAEQLPFGEDFFDAVTCSGAFYFFPDLPRVLNEIVRVLKPSGRLAGMTVVREGILGFRVSERLLGWYQNIGTYRVDEVGEFVGKLREAGLREVDHEIHGCVLLFDARPS